jgi:hypothetical protein
MGEKRTKRGAFIRVRGKVLPIHADADILEFLRTCRREVRDAFDNCSNDIEGHVNWPVTLLRKWRDRIDEMLPAAADGPPQNPAYHGLLDRFGQWKEEHPEGSFSQYCHNHEGAKTEQDVRKLRLALRRQMTARNSA